MSTEFIDLPIQISRASVLLFPTVKLWIAEGRSRRPSPARSALPSSRDPQVVGVAHSFCEVWLVVAGVLAELDVLAGFAELAVNAPTPFVRPEVRRFWGPNQRGVCKFRVWVCKLSPRVSLFLITIQHLKETSDFPSHRKLPLTHASVRF